MTRSLVYRFVALVTVVVVTVAGAHPALLEAASGSVCAPGPDGCSRSCVLGTCCCGHAEPAVPGGARVQPGGEQPSMDAGSGSCGLAATSPAARDAAPRHGHVSTDLTTLHSTLLI